MVVKFELTFVEHRLEGRKEMTEILNSSGRNLEIPEYYVRNGNKF